MVWKKNMVLMKSLKRGDVVWVNLDPTVGGEIQKRRPCVIASLSVLNEKRLTVVVVPL
jgi:mRNA interferase MazF